jgi:hypothetical protein
MFHFDAQICTLTIFISEEEEKSYVPGASVIILFLRFFLFFLHKANVMILVPNKQRGQFQLLNIAILAKLFLRS